MTDFLAVALVVGVVSVICAVVLYGIKGADRLADPPPRHDLD